MLRAPMLDPVTGLQDETAGGGEQSIGGYQAQKESGGPAAGQQSIGGYMEQKAAQQAAASGSGGLDAGAPEANDVATNAASSDVSALGPDLVGDIPPPPIPRAPTIQGTGVAGMQGTEGSTFARPGTQAAAAFHSAQFVPKRPARFGPGVPMAGGGVPVVPGLEESGGPGLSPDEAARLLAQLAGGQGGA